jgi:hypothetical protein
MGPAADFTSSLTPGLSPGVSIKFLRTEASSANFVMIKSLPPLPDNNHNFFSTDLATHIPDDADSTALAALAARQFFFCVYQNFQYYKAKSLASQDLHFFQLIFMSSFFYGLGKINFL